jgi:hypothetical protein
MSVHPVFRFTTSESMLAFNNILFERYLKKTIQECLLYRPVTSASLREGVKDFCLSHYA